MFSYSFLIAKESLKNEDSVEYPRSIDQTHTFAFIADWQISSNWQFFLKAIYGSGYPHTPMIFDIERQDFVEGAKNSLYLPSYKRVDIRINRLFTLFCGKLALYFEIINVFNSKNILGYERYWIIDSENIIKRPQTSFPLLPNMGIRLNL